MSAVVNLSVERLLRSDPHGPDGVFTFAAQGGPTSKNRPDIERHDIREPLIVGSYDPDGYGLMGLDID